MNYIIIFFVSFTIALSGALAPGPLLAAVISESRRHGPKSGPLMMLGHALAETIMIIVLIAGGSYVIRTPAVLKTISLSGAIILSVFGSQMLLSLRTPYALPAKTPSAGKSVLLILKGAGLSVTNPYWTVWWLTIGLGLVLGAAKTGIISIGVFFSGHILADFLWYGFISLVVGQKRDFIHPVLYKYIIAVCALILIGFGVFFGVYSFSENTIFLQTVR